MNHARTPDDREPSNDLRTSAHPLSTGFSGPYFTTTFTYFVEAQPTGFEFVHDKAKGLFILTNADGTTEHFRDKPTRYLVVEPDSTTGELVPKVNGGEPVYLYVCREEREAR
jgi:hypothetical protein